MTMIVELYGGPGSGKSTMAAEVFAGLKRAGVNAELIQECAKEWAWASREIRGLDQITVLAEQINREVRLLGKVDVIVTDSPMHLGHFYVKKYGGFNIPASLIDRVNRETAAAGHTRYRAWVRRVRSYNPAGRFETEAEAREIDFEMRGTLNGVDVVEVHGNTHGAARLLKLVKRSIGKP